MGNEKNKNMKGTNAMKNEDLKPQSVLPDGVVELDDPDVSDVNGGVTISSPLTRYIRV